MPSQRTGGGEMKIHRLDDRDCERTLCGRASFDVGITSKSESVTCGKCKSKLVVPVGKQRCALCGAFYPQFPEGSNKVTCKGCGVVWERG